jgi:hypothetical protein
MWELTSGVRGRRQRWAGLAMVGEGAEPDAVVMGMLAGTASEAVAV